MDRDVELAIFTKIIYFVRPQFSLLKENVRKSEDQTANDQSVNLKDTVASFGAQIQSLETDVKTLKEGYTTLQTAQQTDKQQLDTLRTTVDSITNSTQSGVNQNYQNATTAWMQNITNQCTNGLKNVSDRLTAINDTLSQKTTGLETELQSHNGRLENLSESFANVSSHVTSIESEWPKFKQSNQNFEISIGKMSTDIIDLKANVTYLKETTRALQAEYKQHTDTSVPPNVR